MIMESMHGKGMHYKKERAALLQLSSKFPLSALASPKPQECERFLHLLQPKDLVQFYEFPST